MQVHAFVVMRDHIHVLITPGEENTLERAAQFVKGTFSFRAKRELGVTREIWSQGYFDERIRSSSHCAGVIEYIERNPVTRGLAARPEEFPYGSASGKWKMDAVPDWLRP